MRIAVIILGLCLGIGVAMQSVLIASAASFTGNEAMSSASSSGIIMALLLVIGAAFGHSLPRASIGCFALAAFLGIQAGSTSQFHDLRIWGFVAAALAVMSYFGDRELRARHPKPPTEPKAPFPEGYSQASTDGSVAASESTVAHTGWFDNYQQPPADAVERAEAPRMAIWPVAALRTSAQTPTVQATGTLPATQASIIDQIERLASLKATGAIDDAEYQTLKSQVLGAGQS